MPVLEISLAYFLDLCLGDPDWLPHPIRAIGWMIRRLESPARKLVRNERLAGALLVMLTVAIPVLIVVITLQVAGLAGPWYRSAVAVCWLYLGFSTRSLSDHAGQVAHDLERNDIAAARRSVARIVGRDTAELNAGEVSRAAVESVAESGVDGLLSPFFFAALGGAPMLWAFKAVSTCDSMIGYKDERYLRFGTFGARLDDVLNYLPARLALLVFPAAAGLTGSSGRTAWRIARRDRRHHASPNAGIPEAAMAGALQIRLGGPTVYDGEVEKKEYFGAEFRAPEPPDVRRSIRLIWAVGALGFLLACGGVWLRAHWVL